MRQEHEVDQYRTTDYRALRLLDARALCIGHGDGLFLLFLKDDYHGTGYCRLGARGVQLHHDHHDDALESFPVQARFEAGHRTDCEIE
ncbi:MAG TPA: hypothetical protein VKT27_16395 [Candidatus Binataceae bacterium]|nr:hypothetical protein [Candidatus Binataceae bacterium]